MLLGHESLQMYKRGIEVLKNDVERYKVAQRFEDASLACRQVASAYASISDLFMTHLCDEPNAEAQCEQALKDALDIHSENVDALQSLANLRMVRNNYDEARGHLMKVY
mmetsp:Transcript_16103/g.27210  ORF Transcript_16103/g.27210 Transcript_16103/m.27210 type:complete len:109 (-) Transcript_16103:566-892(-)